MPWVPAHCPGQAERSWSSASLCQLTGAAGQAGLSEQRGCRQSWGGGREIGDEARSCLAGLLPLSPLTLPGKLVALGGDWHQILGP